MTEPNPAPDAEVDDTADTDTTSDADISSETKAEATPESDADTTDTDTDTSTESDTETEPKPEPKAKAKSKAKKSTSDKAPPKTIATSGDVTKHDDVLDDDDPVGAWPDDWREQIADGDEAASKMLSRLADPKALVKKLVNQDKVIRSRKPIPEVPGKNASEEDWADYRKAMGLPLAPEGYLEKLSLPDGRTLGSTDKPIAESFATALHGANASQEAVNAAVSWYFDMQEAKEAETIEADDAYRQENRDTLRDEWGADFKRNINAISHLFTDAPGGANPNDADSLMSRIFTARTQDGRMLGDDADFVRFLSGVVLELKPEATILPGKSGGDLKSVQEELAELNKLVAKDDSEYWRGPKSKQLQERFAELLKAEEALRQRA